MDRDGFMLIAFLAFILLLLWRNRQKQQTSRETGETAGVDSPRTVFNRVKLLGFAAAAVYMLVVTIRDYESFRGLSDTSFLLRCLIFVFTIYVLVDGIIRMLRH